MSLGLLIATAVGASLVALGGLQLRGAWRTFGDAAWLRRTRVRTVATLTAGPAVVQGGVHAAEAPVVSVSQRPCVWLQTTLEVWVSAGQFSGFRAVASDTRSVKAEARDASGACLLDLSDAEVVGEEWCAETEAFLLRRLAPEVADVLLQATPTAVDLLVKRSARKTVARTAEIFHGRRLRVVERFVADGARVLVAGVAGAAGMAPGEGYRDVQPTFRLGAGGRRKLLVSTCGRRATIWRVAWPAVAIVLTGVLTLALGATLLAVRWTGEQYVQ